MTLRGTITASSSKWQNKAICRGTDTDDFFDDEATGAAKAACRYCPVRQQCLDQAMTAEGTLSAAGRYGIFGGLTPEERAALAQCSPAPKPAPVPFEEPMPHPRWNGRQLKPCGTRAAYKRHSRRGEQPCQACKDAEARARGERDARPKGATT